MSVFIKMYIYWSYTTDGSTAITMTIRTSTLTYSTSQSITSQYKRTFIWYTKNMWIEKHQKYRIWHLQGHINKQLLNSFANTNMIHIGTHSIQHLYVLSNFPHVNWTYVWTKNRISKSNQFESEQKLHKQLIIEKEE